MHLLLACAPWPFEGPPPALDARVLPNLHRLLARLQPGAWTRGPAGALTPPHERLRAADLGLDAPDGCLPWAAWSARESHDPQGREAWAWISPAHWTVGSAAVVMDDPARLALAEDESRALLAAMQPYFAEDGITLHFHAADRWLARATAFERLPTAALDCVVGQPLADWMPAAPWLRRLQNEMQMLLYLHPVNDARQARGQPPVNAFWVHGSGRLPEPVPAPSGTAPIEPQALRLAARGDDPDAWLRAWQAIDALEARALRDRLESTQEPLRLSLCGAHDAITFGPARRGALARLGAALRPRPLAAWLEAL